MDHRNLVPLPPKRFEPINNPEFDSIRHHLWFKSLERRRVKIPLVLAAWSKMEKDVGVTQVAAAKHYGIDSRELRSYQHYLEGSAYFAEGQRPKYQQMIDSAYEYYVSAKGNRSFSWCMEKIAKLYGHNPRRLKEAWDIMADFYPTNYK